MVSQRCEHTLLKKSPTKKENLVLARGLPFSRSVSLGNHKYWYASIFSANKWAERLQARQRELPTYFII